MHYSVRVEAAGLRAETRQECLEESALLLCSALFHAAEVMGGEQGGGFVFVGRQRRKCRWNAVRNHRILSFQFQFGFSFLIFSLSGQLLWTDQQKPVFHCSNVLHCTTGFSGSTFITRHAFNSIHNHHLLLDF